MSETKSSRIVRSLYLTPVVPFDSDRLWQWQLMRQGLGQGLGLPDLTVTAARSLGLHAARVGSPYATAAARLARAEPLAGLLGRDGDPELITLRCMRKTLHTLPVGLATLAHAATRSFRLADVHSRIRRSGLNSVLVEVAGREILRYLDDQGSSSSAEIERAMASLGFCQGAARLGLKLLWENGDVTYRNCATSWHRQQRRFGLRSRMHPGFLPDAMEGPAIDGLVEAYFHRYGPAAVEDAAWWSGLSQSRIMVALSKLNPVRVPSPWSNGENFMLAEDVDRFSADRLAGSQVGAHLLAHEDVALKAYSLTRARYMRELPAMAAFNSIGEVLPTVMFDGLIIGRWAWAADTRRITFQFFGGRATLDMREAAHAQALKLQGRLRAGYLVGDAD